MLVLSPEDIPKLRKISVPKQSGTDTLVTSMAALVDRSLMRTVSFVVEKKILPRDVDLDMLRESMREMLDTDLLDNPQDFFKFVSELESGRDAGCAQLQTGKRRRIRGGSIVRRKLSSSYTPYSQLPQAGDTAEKSDLIQFEHWVHAPRDSLGTVIVLHGFAMGWPVIDAVVMSAKQWFARGFDVILLTLPDHGARRPKGALFSGQSYTVPHAVHLALAVRQAIHEIFELKAWLREQSHQPVGLVGMSLGGYLASLCAGLSDDFDFLVPLVPPACMGDLAWRVYRDTRHHRSGLDEMLTEDNMRAAFYAHSPLAHPRKTATDRILIVAGAGDRIVPPEHPSALWEHWDRPKIHWLRGSHMAPAASSSLVQVVTEHLNKLKIL